MRTEKFMRKTFPIDAVQVTEENMEEVANWCKGVIETTPSEIAEAVGRPAETWIRVKVHNPLDDRQTQAFVGDWVLYTNRSYKCYRDRPFKRSFEPVFRGEVGEADNQETNRRLEASEISVSSGQHQNPESVKDKVYDNKPKGLNPRPVPTAPATRVIKEATLQSISLDKEPGPAGGEIIKVEPTGQATVEDPIIEELHRRGLDIEDGEILEGQTHEEREIPEVEVEVTPGPTEGTHFFNDKVHNHEQQYGCGKSCPARADES